MVRGGKYVAGIIPLLQQFFLGLRPFRALSKGPLKDVLLMTRAPVAASLQRF